MSEMIPAPDPSRPAYSCPTGGVERPFVEQEAPGRYSYETGIREIRGDLETNDAVLTGNLSLSHRPDAISFNYQTCFTVGPVAQGDNTQGAVSFVWRLRQEGTSIFICRAEGSAWGTESLLFSYFGAAATEIDSAFDQSGRVFVCAQRATGIGGAPEVWVYYFNTVSSGYEFIVAGPGRNPRALLDEAVDTAISDVLCFYINDTLGSFAYRQQRDRYLVEYTVPLAAANRFVEDVYKAIDGRVHVLYSERDVVAGRYTLGHIESALYPLNARDSASVTSTLLEIIEFVIPDRLVYDSVSVSADVFLVTLQEPLLSASIADSADVTAALIGVTLLQPVLSSMLPAESASLSAVLQGITNIVVILPYTSPAESTNVTAVLQSVTLAA